MLRLFQIRWRNLIGFILCNHATTTWPVKESKEKLGQVGIQKCWDCGAWRTYDFSTMKVGKWMRGV